MKFAVVYDTEEQKNYIPQVLSMLSEIGEADTITSADVMNSTLYNYHAVVFPGGIASWYGLRKYGVDFAHAVRYFVAAGGGYLGVCGGAYIAGREPSIVFNLYCNRSLALADIWTQPPPLIATLKEYYEMQWHRFPIEVIITSKTHPIIQGHENEEVEIAYSGGAIMVDPGEAVTPLAFFEDGKVAAMATTFGLGRVVLCSPHPEAPWVGDVGEPSLPWLYPRMAKWVAEREIKVSYAVTPWRKPSPLSSGLPIALGTGALAIGAIIGAKTRS